jgi:hypothetical protein
MQSQQVASQALLRAERADARSEKTTGAASSVDAADGGWALRYAGGSAPVRHPILTTVTFLNGRNRDIFIWWTHGVARFESLALVVLQLTI